MVNINNLMESLRECTGRMRSIENIYPVSTDGDIKINHGNGYCQVDMLLEGKPVRMRCWLGKDRERAERLGKVSSYLSSIDEPSYNRFTFYPSELLVFNDNGGYEYLDVCVEDKPAGIPLWAYAEGCLYGNNPGGAEMLPQITSALTSLAVRHYGHGIDTGGIVPGRLYVKPSGELLLSGFHNASRGGCIADIYALAGIFCLFALARADRRTLEFIARTGQPLSPFLQRCAGADWLPQPLKDLCGIVSGGGSAEPELLEAMIETGASPMPPLRELSWLLDELGFENETTVIVRPVTKKYEFVGPLCCMLMSARDAEGWCYLDKNGRVAIPGPFREASDFWENLVVVELEEGFGVIDTEGRYIVEPVYEDIEIDFTGNRLIVTDDGRSALMTLAGEMVTPLIYERIMSESEGMFMVEKDGKFGFITRDGDKITDIIYDEAESFRGGVATATRRGHKYTIGVGGEEFDEIIDKPHLAK